MSKQVAFKRLGLESYPEIYDLYRRNENDPRIREEFGDGFYHFLTPNSTKNRVLDMYVNGIPLRVGELMYTEGPNARAVGFGWLGLSEEVKILTPEEQVFLGANVSGFIEEDYRNKDLGKLGAIKLLEDFLEMQEKSEVWRSATLWTGAKPENAASIGLLSSLGFEKVGILGNDSRYDVYTY